MDFVFLLILHAKCVRIFEEDKLVENQLVYRLVFIPNYKKGASFNFLIEREIDKRVET